MCRKEETVVLRRWDLWEGGLSGGVQKQAWGWGVSSAKTLEGWWSEQIDRANVSMSEEQKQLSVFLRGNRKMLQGEDLRKAPNLTVTKIPEACIWRWLHRRLKEKLPEGPRENPGPWQQVQFLLFDPPIFPRCSYVASIPGTCKHSTVV